VATRRAWTLCALSEAPVRRAIIGSAGPIAATSFVPNKPGISIELNPDTVKVHFAEGER